MTLDELYNHRKEVIELQDLIITKDRLNRFRDAAARNGNRNLKEIADSIDEITEDIRNAKRRIKANRKQIQSMLPYSTVDRHREVLDLYFFSGFSVIEISAALGYSEKSCKSTIKQLERILTGRADSDEEERKGIEEVQKDRKNIVTESDKTPESR